MNIQEMDKIYFGEHWYYLFPGKWNNIREDNIFRCEIQPNINFEELEQILKDTNNTQKVVVKTWYDDAIALVIEGFIEVHHIYKHFNKIIGYQNIDGVRVPILSDTIEIELRKMGSETRFNQIQSNLEYVAIMADIDIHEDNE